MPRGAPKGNQYAKKEQSERGDSISLYLDSYTMEFLQAACELDGKPPTRANAKERAKNLAKEAITADVRKTFFDPRLAEKFGIDPAALK